MLIDTVPPGPLLQVINGDLVFYDDTRTTWLSSSSTAVSFGLNNRNIENDRFLAMVGKVYSNNSGYRIIKNATITSISVQTTNVADCAFRIRKNNSPINLESIILTNETGKSISTINVSINQGDFLQCFMEVNTGNVDFPELILNYSWRQ